MKEKQLEALIRKATGKTVSDKGRRTRFVDPTLEATRPTEEQRGDEKLFKEMKRREF